MSGIDFSTLELDEDTKAALDIVTANEAVTGYISQSIENRVNAVKESSDADLKQEKERLSEFRETNIQLKKDLEQYEAIDKEKYGRLIALGSDAANASEKIKTIETEYQAKLDGATRKVAEYESKFAEIEQEREKDFIRRSVMDGVREWNTKNPQVAVEAGAEEVIADKALLNYKLIDGKPVMLKGDDEFTTDNGFGTMTEWVGNVARESMPYLFKKIQGSGASGNSGGGAVDKKWSEMNGAERTALFHADKAKFDRLSKQG